MTKKVIDCENEPIHLIGRIQNFGKILILSQDLKIVGISENFEDWIGGNPQLYLDQPAASLLENCSFEESKPIISLIQQVAVNPETRELLETTFLNSLFTIRVYQSCGLIYIEFEDKNILLPQILNFSTYSKNINKSGDKLWDALTENIKKIIGYDRVMVYQFMEDNSGQVIAESKPEEETSFLGYRYPEFDIPMQARELYLKHHARQTSDIKAKTHPIFSKSDQAFDLSESNLRALSPVHLKYLENTGVKASLSFSILIQDKLWGLVTCLNSKSRHVDHTERTICLFLTEFTANRHLTLLKERDIEYTKRASSLELKLRESILLKNNTLTALSEALPELKDILRADGMAIFHQNSVITHKAGVSKKLLYSLHNYINNLTNETIFKDHQFNLLHGQKNNWDLPFAGLCRVDIDANRSFSIYAFRNEVIFEENWAGKPEKVIEYDQQLDAYKASPRQSFEAWKLSVHGTSPRWTDEDIYILRQIRQVIKDSLLQKSEELNKLNQELIQLNNALDTYSYTITHDLKNPLSSIKLMGQFLKDKLGQEHPFVLRGTTTILDSVANMEALIDKIFEFSRAKVYEFTPEWVDMSTTITNISESCANRYNVSFTNVQIENTLPIFGEKTLLYQLFSNLISNAIKYSSQIAKPQISIQSYIDHGSLCYVITDNGIGISSDELSQIYDVFKRMSNSAGFEGAGVGMEKNS
ncbi:ATP-binding protein [Sphingobacterium sp. LRF_L2]|uniref:ATP-binding protein n=1 Tax=Sphingobacterium sp. LRF_L2 TaxID=3369421 RepID=UPI003F62C725